MSARRDSRVNAWNPALPRDDEHLSNLLALGETMDLNATATLRALIIGAMTRGNAATLIRQGVEHLPPEATKAPPRDRPKWDVVDDSGRANVYGRGPYRLHHEGNLGGVNPGEWFLTGPGLRRKTPMGKRRQEALEKADGLISRLDHDNRTAAAKDAAVLRDRIERSAS